MPLMAQRKEIGMSERAEDKKLQELRDAGHEIYSFSRLDSINNCLYGAYKKYVLHEKEKPNVYSSLGGRIHDTLEAIVNHQATEEDLLPAMNDELEDMDMLGIEFPLDKNGESTIRNNWIKNMTHFATTYKSPKKKNLYTEQLVIYKTSSNKYLQGYIDLIWEYKKGEISIYDYKTSTLYSAKDMKEHARQLIVYALAKEQEGYKVRDVSFIFLKYVTVSFMGYKTTKSKEKTEIVKNIERRKIGAELSKYIKADMEELGCDSLDIELTLDNVSKKGYSEETVPEEIYKHFTIKPCVVSVELTDETRQETIDYIEQTISLWESLDTEDEKNFPPCKFTKVAASSGKEVMDCFFCASLCGYGDNCKHYHDFRDTWDNDNDDDDDLF